MVSNVIRDRSRSSIVLIVVTHTTLLILLLVTLLPIIHIAAMSVSKAGPVMRGEVTLWPREFTLESYNRIFSGWRIPRGFRNAILYTLVGSAINMIMTAAMAYGLSHRQLVFRSFYMTMIVITMFFSGGIIPLFLLVLRLGMYDTMWAIVLPVAISAWNLIILRTFFQAMPQEMKEVAHLEGASELTILLRVIVPLSTPALAAIFLFYATSHWNSYFSALMFLRDRDKLPLQIILREIVLQNRLRVGYEAGIPEVDMEVIQETIKYAVLFVSLVPMLLMYPFIQRYFVKGVMIGSLKG